MALTAPITCLTAGGLGAVYALLQLRVGLHRFNCNILFDSKKDNGDEDQKLTAMSRCGGNMQEYVPTGMLLLLLLETQTDAPKKLVAAYAAAFAAARLSHAYALSNTYTPNVNWLPFRVGGFLSTVGLLAAGGAYLALSGAKALRK